jgi:tetratricopeptide (TPR) repeat protein
MPKLEGESDFQFAEIGNGIDCERCHGPGSLHVNERKKGEGVDVNTSIDPNIVNPRKLSWQRQIDLCQRCHLQGLNVLKEGKKFTDFKPGMRLSDVFEIYLPEYEGESASFDMANHSERFQMSQCFIQGNKEQLDFTCISCHNPHVSVKVTGSEVYNTACKNCHKVNVCKEDKIKLTKAGNNCVSCHMPATGSEDIPHVSVHDHYIRIPKAASDVAERQKLVGLYAVNNPSPDKETEIRAYLEYWEKFDKNPFYLKMAGEKLAGTDYPRLWLKYYYLSEKYAEATSVKLDLDQLSSWELFTLGESYGKQKAWSQAIYYLEKSYGMDATLPDVGKQLLRYYITQGELKKAEIIANELGSKFPKNGSIINLKAKILIMTGDFDKALPYMERSLSLEPDDIDVWGTHLNYYASLGEKSNFLFWANKIKRKAPNYVSPAVIEELLDKM